MCAHKLGKNRQRSPHAGRLRERTAGEGKPRETMLLLVSSL